MTEFKLTIEAPAIVDAINSLANAILNRPVATAPAEAPKITSGSKKNKNVERPADPVATPAVAIPVAPVVDPAPVAAPVVPAAPVVSASVPVTVPAPVVPAAPDPVVPTAPQTAAVPTPAPVAPAAPVATLTMEALANAGAGLLERGLMQQLLGLLGQFGVQSVTALRPDQFPAFADGLRALGANI